MPHPQFNRFDVKMRPLAERENKMSIEESKVLPGSDARELEEKSMNVISECATRIRKARKNNKPVMLTYGAHSIKNCLAPVLISLMEKGWIQHLATNGAGIIHDWEFAWQGHTSEDVQKYVSEGQFGNWQETGFYLNLAINCGARDGLGYGESLGRFIEEEGLMIPSKKELQETVRQTIISQPKLAAANADLLSIITKFEIEAGWMSVPHKWKEFSVQAAAYRLQIPSTGHPMFGHDIIYNHPMNHGPSIGRAAERDFLSFAENVRQLNGGVYMSIGSAVMSPMVFEKSMSISKNVELQKGKDINQHYILVVDLQKSSWDWTQGEPPESNPDYYLRYNKSFNRMGGEMRYVSADNRDFLLHLHKTLSEN